MEKISRIKIGDLPGNPKFSREEMRHILGGWSILWGRYVYGSIEGDSSLKGEGDSNYYRFDVATGDIIYY